MLRCFCRCYIDNIIGVVIACGDMLRLDPAVYTDMAVYTDISSRCGQRSKQQNAQNRG